MDHDPLSKTRMPEVVDGLAGSHKSESPGEHCNQGLSAGVSDSKHLVAPAIQTTSSTGVPRSDNSVSETPIHSDSLGSIAFLLVMLCVLATNISYAEISEADYQNQLPYEAYDYDKTCVFINGLTQPIKVRLSKIPNPSRHLIISSEVVYGTGVKCYKAGMASSYVEYCQSPRKTLYDRILFSQNSATIKKLRSKDRVTKEIGLKTPYGADDLILGCEGDTAKISFNKNALVAIEIVRQD